MSHDLVLRENDGNELTVEKQKAVSCDGGGGVAAYFIMLYEF